MATSDIFGVKDLFGITPPAGGVVEESSCEENFDADEVIDGEGEVARACPKTWGRKTARIRGRGSITPVTLVGQTITAGVEFITSRVLREKNDAEPTFEITQESFIDNFTVTP